MGIGFACLVMAPIMQLLHVTTQGGIGGTELLKLDENGNLTVAGTMNSTTGSIDGGSF